MNVVELGRLHSSANAIGISHAEWAALRGSRRADALTFYVELRRNLASEYEAQRPFHLPARQLAAQGFLPRRRDRKLYMRLTNELLRLGLIERVKKAGFSAVGRRTAAAFVFMRPSNSSTDTVVFLTHYRRTTNVIP